MNLPVTSKDQGDKSTNPCFHQPNNPSQFYNNDTAMQFFQNRIEHILNHKNPYFNNRPWHNLSEAIYSFDIQHKTQAYSTPRNEGWTCAMANVAKSLLSPNIHVSTGGGADLSDSVMPSNFRCQHVDIVSLNAQYLNEFYIKDQLSTAKILASQYGKPLLLNAFGALSVRPKFFARVMQMCHEMRISWLVWSFVKPGQNSDRMEFYNQDEKTMEVISTRALEIWSNTSTIAAKNWTNYMVPPGLTPNSILDWRNCVDSIECRYTLAKTVCCSNIYSLSDGVAKCTPGGC
jgi:hypothetical protein